MKKIVIFGCQLITQDIINFLIKNKLKPSLVVTYEVYSDKLLNVDIKKICREKKIKIFFNKKIDDNLILEIEKIKPDLIISSYYRKIIPYKIIKLSKLSINIHPSLLPFYRGPVPSAWAILNNEKFTGVTIHKMDKGIDAGDIIFQKKIKIDKKITGFKLSQKLMIESFIIFKKNFSKIIKNKFKIIKQDKTGSYYGKLDSNLLINWKNKADDIINFIRVFASPYASARTLLFNKYLFIDEAEKFFLKGYIAQKPGKIISVKKDFIIVSCADGLIKLVKYNFFRPFKDKKEKKIYLKLGNQFD
jgi:methionyl-tRNA formyltransferase